MLQVDARKPDFAGRAAEDRKYYVKMTNPDDFGPILGGTLSEGSARSS